MAFSILLVLVIRLQIPWGYWVMFDKFKIR